MTHIAYTRCDHDDCYDEQTTDRIGWRTVDGEDYCPRHDPCATCGHQRHEHAHGWDLLGCDGCVAGRVVDYPNKRPGRTMFGGRVLDWLVETSDAVITTDPCGCPTFAEPA